MLNETAEQDKTKDISTDINQAYETVDVLCVQPREVGKAGSESTAEAIYECPLCYIDRGHQILCCCFM